MAMMSKESDLSLIDEAHRLLYWAVAQSSRSRLDEKTSMWVIKRDAWLKFMSSQESARLLVVDLTGARRNELLGLPVRLTIGDEPDVPMIQLVMEPMIAPRR